MPRAGCWVPGSIGAAAIPGGQKRNIAVPLTEPLQPGDRLIAMLHLDSGQPGVYEFGTASTAEDKPVVYQGQAGRRGDRPGLTGRIAAQGR